MFQKAFKHITIGVRNLYLLGAVGMDTTAPNSKLLYDIMCAVAGLERQMIRERTKAGLESARKQERVDGRPNVEGKTKRKIIALKNSGERAVDIADGYGIARSTVYKILKEG